MINRVYLLDFSKLEKGTVVIMSISNFSNKKTAEIFDKYTNKDNNFTKTVISCSQSGVFIVERLKI